MKHKITPILIDGRKEWIYHNVKVLEHTLEILESIKSIEAKNPIYFSPEHFNHPEIQCILSDNINSVPAYSNFCIKLGEFLKDDSYILVCQYDGYPLYKENWTDEFLEYDYIGSPWGTDRPDHKRVGNGGFSLRSARLIKLVSELVPNPNGFSEDLVICDVLGDILQQNYNIKFAPISLAMKFSFEHYIPERNDMQLNECFGFHDFKCGPIEEKNKHRIKI